MSGLAGIDVLPTPVIKNFARTVSGTLQHQIQIALAGKREKVTLKQARSGVMVRPEATADKRVKVW